MISGPLSGLARELRAYQSLPLHDLWDSRPHASSLYRLRRYKWRTFLNIVGPSLVLAFYAFICIHFLSKPPVNDIVPATRVNALWINYSWMVLSVFILDWARSALANLEATALMNASLAPHSAMELMWHADNNWNNFFWWLRAVRNKLMGTMRPKSHHISQPGGLWWTLTFVTILIFVAVPLGGLTMELTDAFTYSINKVLIVGPTSDNFNFLGFVDLPNQIRASWRSGRFTTPSDSSILYAVEGSLNVSKTYYQDQLLKSEESSMIQVFAGPAVHEPVVGSAWGLSANISCRPTARGQLKIADVHDYDQYTLKVNGETTEKIRWFNETDFHLGTLYSLVAASDGTWYGDSPYCDISNHDAMTLDHDTRPLTDVTTGLLEVYLWQGVHQPRNAQYRDNVMDQLLKSDSELISISHVRAPADPEKMIPVAGFGVHCEITSAVGTAEVDPAHRTFSSFQRGSSKSTGTDQMAYGIQVQAYRAIANFDAKNYEANPRNPSGSDSTLIAAHFALGILPVWNNIDLNAFTDINVAFPALTPANLTTAMYKVLGESVIALMGPGMHIPTYGDLYGLTPVKYLKPGVIPWEPVFILLSVWAALIVSTSVWMACYRRWATSLNAFEFFKFGAQYTNDVNNFSSTKFEECERLRKIPGMVGILSGEISDRKEGLIGLSNERAR